MKKFIILFILIASVTSYAEEKILLQETFDDLKSLKDFNSKWTHSTVSKGGAKLTGKLSESGKALEVKVEEGKGIQYKLKFPPVSRIKVSARIYFMADSNFFFRNGFFAVKSGNEYAVANIVSKCKGKDMAVMQHSERYASRGFTPLETIPCGKWVTLSFVVDCEKDSVIYEAVWDKWKWKEKTILSRKVKKVDEAILRTSWRKNEKNYFYIDDITISTY